MFFGYVGSVCSLHILNLCILRQVRLWKSLTGWFLKQLIHPRSKRRALKVCKRNWLKSRNVVFLCARQAKALNLWSKYCTQYRRCSTTACFLWRNMISDDRDKTSLLRWRRFYPTSSDPPLVCAGNTYAALLVLKYQTRFLKIRPVVLSLMSMSLKKLNRSFKQHSQWA